MNHRTPICVCVCIAALISTAPAWAQLSPGTVAVYGLIDQGVERVSGVSTGNGNTTSDYRVGSGIAASRLGFRGSEDLGNGLKAVFTLEQGFGADVGTLSQGGRVFGRQAFVGLQGGFGTLTFGRQMTMRFYGMMDADLFGAGSHGLGSLDSGVPNARADNAISYRGNWGAFSGGVNFSLGRDASPTAATTSAAATNCPGEAADKKQCREWSVMGKYDGGTWGVVGAYERQYGGTPAVAATATTAAIPATFGGLTSSAKTDTRVTLNGYLNINGNRVGMGLLTRNNEGSAATPKSDLFWLSGQVPVPATPFVIDAMVAQIKFENSPNKATLLTLRGNYVLSKRTTLYLTTAHIRNSGTLALTATTNAPATAPLPGGSQTSVMTGIRHTF